MKKMLSWQLPEKKKFLIFHLVLVLGFIKYMNPINYIYLLCNYSVELLIITIIYQWVNDHLITSFLFSSWSQSLEAEDEEVSGTKANLRVTPQWPSPVRLGAAKLLFSRVQFTLHVLLTPFTCPHGPDHVDDQA